MRSKIEGKPKRSRHIQFIKSLVILCFIISSIASKAQTIEGFVITLKNDTIHSQFSVDPKKRIEQNNNFLFVKMIAGDSTITYTARDIRGFGKGNSFFKSFHPAEKDSSFFARQITSGKVELYYAPGREGKYYFKKTGENHFYEMDCKSQSIMIVNEGGYFQPMNDLQASHRKIPIIKSNEPAFQTFFMNYFKNSSSIVFKLKGEFYNFTNLETMFKEYNQQKS